MRKSFAACGLNPFYFRALILRENCRKCRGAGKSQSLLLQGAHLTAEPVAVSEHATVSIPSTSGRSSYSSAPCAGNTTRLNPFYFRALILRRWIRYDAMNSLSQSLLLQGAHLTAKIKTTIRLHETSQSLLLQGAHLTHHGAVVHLGNRSLNPFYFRALILQEKPAASAAVAASQSLLLQGAHLTATECITPWCNSSLNPFYFRALILPRAPGSFREEKVSIPSTSGRSSYIALGLPSAIETASQSLLLQGAHLTPMRI